MTKLHILTLCTQIRCLHMQTIVLQLSTYAYERFLCGVHMLTSSPHMKACICSHYDHICTHKVYICWHHVNKYCSYFWNTWRAIHAHAIKHRNYPLRGLACGNSWNSIVPKFRNSWHHRYIRLVPLALLNKCPCCCAVYCVLKINSIPSLALKLCFKASRTLCYSFFHWSKISLTEMLLLSVWLCSLSLALPVSGYVYCSNDGDSRNTEISCKLL